MNIIEHRLAATRSSLSRSSACALHCLIAVLATGAVRSQVVNGDFSLGNTGFTSDFISLLSGYFRAHVELNLMGSV